MTNASDATALSYGRLSLTVSTVCQLVTLLFLFFAIMITVAMVAALVEGTILCMHGGLSPDLKDFEQVSNEMHIMLLSVL